MKTIATAAVLMMLAAPTWADEAKNEQATNNTGKPIVLSEAELDGVTAGVWRYDSTNFRLYYSSYDTSTSTSSKTELDVMIIGDLNSY